MKIILELLRVRDWTKNLFVFLPIIFGGELLAGCVLLKGLEVFVCFCILASAIYIVNDLHDCGYDRSHPAKFMRPIAAGIVPRPLAIASFLALTGFGTVLSFFLLKDTPEAVLALLGYFFLNLLYTFWLKELAIIDVMAIAAGFVLRVVAGGAACGIWVSPWLIVMTFLLTLFIAFGKRRDDVVRISKGNQPRKSAAGYSLPFIDMTMSVLAACLLGAYLVYSLSPEVEARFNSSCVYLTSIFVIAGILRYMQDTMVNTGSGDPVRLFYRDPFIIGCSLLWLASFILIIYG